MIRSRVRQVVPIALALSSAGLAACSGSPRSTPPATPAPASAPPTPSATAAESEAAAIARARADSVRLPYTAADIRFMTNMIGHHAQALEMAKLAPTHGASPQVQTLAARIINAQRDEIRLMQSWLRHRRQPVPDPSADGLHAGHGAGQHGAMMPGMLSHEQMLRLDAARGHEFDRLFLTFMIQHHRGAVSMVDELFGTPGAAQDEAAFRFASDVQVDQRTEIARMERMLADVITGG